MSSASIAEPGQLFALAHEDLACYSIAQWPEFERAPHHELIVSKLEAVERGELKRLMIFLPPRHGKSGLSPAPELDLYFTRSGMVCPPHGG